MICGFDNCNNKLLNSKFTAEPIGNFKICVLCFKDKVMKMQLKIKSDKRKEEYKIWGVPYE